MEVEADQRASRDMQAPPSVHRVKPLGEDFLVDHPIDVANCHAGDHGSLGRRQQFDVGGHRVSNKASDASDDIIHPGWKAR
jgi:hypothetical protein